MKRNHACITSRSVLQLHLPGSHATRTWVRNEVAGATRNEDFLPITPPDPCRRAQVQIAADRRSSSEEKLAKPVPGTCCGQEQLDTHGAAILPLENATLSHREASVHTRSSLCAGVPLGCGSCYCSRNELDLDVFQANLKHYESTYQKNDPSPLTPVSSLERPMLS